MFNNDLYGNMPVFLRSKIRIFHSSCFLHFQANQECDCEIESACMSVYQGDGTGLIVRPI